MFKQFDSFINIIYLIKSDTTGLGRTKDSQRNGKGWLQDTQQCGLSETLAP